MRDNRQAERLQQENEITIKIISTNKLPAGKKIIYHISKDISSTGARIQSNVFLPVDTLLKIQMILKDPPRLIEALGKVMWIRSLYADESFEAGLEFIDTSSDSIKLMSEHIEKTKKVKALS